MASNGLTNLKRADNALLGAGLVLAAYGLVLFLGAAIATPGSVPPGDADAIWEALSRGARLAQQFRASRRIAAAAMTWKGRGRTVGPVNGDLLVRFGVSAWR